MDQNLLKQLLEAIGNIQNNVGQPQFLSPTPEVFGGQNLPTQLDTNIRRNVMMNSLKLRNYLRQLQPPSIVGRGSNRNDVRYMLRPQTGGQYNRGLENLINSPEYENLVSGRGI
jgi:hypothetical protein